MRFLSINGIGYNTDIFKKIFVSTVQDTQKNTSILVGFFVNDDHQSIVQKMPYKFHPKVQINDELEKRILNRMVDLLNDGYICDFENLLRKVLQEVEISSIQA